MSEARNALFLIVLMLLFPSVSFASSFTSTSTVGSGFGVQVKGNYADDAELQHIHAVGFGYVRFSVGWQSVEVAPGEFEWDEVDTFVAKIRTHGLKMVIPLLGGNSAYDGCVLAPLKNTDHVVHRPRAPSTPETVQAYARFAAHMVRRYGVDDIVWEIWNEPDLARFWPPQSDVDQFAVLAQTACQEMRRIAPNATIIGPSLGRIPDPQDGVTPAYISSILSSGVQRCLNAISVHPYRHGAEEPEAVFRDYATMVGLLAQKKVFLPIVNSEWGYTTLQTSEEKQAAYVLRTRLTDMIWGVPLSIWYEWKDSLDDPTDPEGHFGLKAFDGQPKPALSALEGVLPFIKDAVFEKQIATKDPHDVLLLLKQPDGRKVIVGWTLRKDTKIALKAGKDKNGILLSEFPSILATGHDLSDAILEQQ